MASSRSFVRACAKHNRHQNQKRIPRAQQVAVGASAAAALYLGVTPPASAVVIHNPTGFTLPTPNSAVEWDIDGVGGASFQVRRETYSTTFNSTTTYGTFVYGSLNIDSSGRNGRGFMRLTYDSTFAIRNLPTGVLVGPVLGSGYVFGASQTYHVAASFNSTYACTSGGCSTYFSTNFPEAYGFNPNEPGFVGFRFEAGGLHYGWAEVVFDPAGIPIEVLQWAYEDIANQPVMVGSLEGVPTLAGDYNNDGKVSAADFTVWRGNIGAPTLTNRDPDGTGPVDNDDFEFWKEQYGAGDFGSGAGLGMDAASVPEPSSAALGGLALLACGAAGVRLWRKEKHAKVAPHSAER